MLVMRTFINLFCVPAIIVCFVYKKNKQAYICNIELLVTYCIAVACNIPVTRLITLIIKKTIGFNIEADSSYYTMAAIIAAWLIPYIFALGKKIADGLNNALGDEE